MLLNYVAALLRLECLLKQFAGYVVVRIVTANQAAGEAAVLGLDETSIFI